MVLTIPLPRKKIDNPEDRAHKKPMRRLTPAVVLALALPACAGEDGPSAIHWQAPIQVAGGEAHRGPWRMNDSDFRYVDDPTVAISPAGGIGVAWVNQSGKDVHFQRYGFDGKARLAEPVNVSRSPDVFSWLPRLAFTGRDEAHVLWQEIVFSGGSHGGEIFYARTDDGGATFSEPVNLSNTTNGAGKGRLTARYWHNGSLDIAAGAGGRLYAAWTEYQGPMRVARSGDGGRTWSKPVLVAGGRGELPARGPSLTVGPDARVHLAWTVGEDPAADIRYAVSTDGAQTFGDSEIVHAGAAHADAPKLAVAADGTVHLAWMESPGGPLRAYRIKYARRPFRAGDFDQPAEISGPLPEEFDHARFPHLALDGNGNPHVLFELFGRRAQRGQGLGLTWSDDGGDSFTAPLAIPRGTDANTAVNGSLQGLLMQKLAVSRAGDIAVVNSTYREGDTSRVWLVSGKKP